MLWSGFELATCGYWHLCLAYVSPSVALSCGATKFVFDDSAFQQISAVIIVSNHHVGHFSFRKGKWWVVANLKSSKDCYIWVTIVDRWLFYAVLSIARSSSRVLNMLTPSDHLRLFTTSSFAFRFLDHPALYDSSVWYPWSTHRKRPPAVYCVNE